MHACLRTSPYAREGRCKEVNLCTALSCVCGWVREHLGNMRGAAGARDIQPPYWHSPPGVTEPWMPPWIIAKPGPAASSLSCKAVLVTCKLYKLILTELILSFHQYLRENGEPIPFVVLLIKPHKHRVMTLSMDGVLMSPYVPLKPKGVPAGDTAR